jgi:hypothetical protein
MDLLNYLVNVDEEELGIDMIAFTENPAIITKGFAFKNQTKSYFSDNLKYRIVAPAMIPGKIYRRDDENGEYYVEFTTETIEKIYSKFMKKLSNGGGEVFNLEHNSDVKVPAYILEAWLVEDLENDKSRKYNIDVPIGTLMLVVQVTDKEYYHKLVSEDRVGFSIEGDFGLELELSETYNDYPQAATVNAQRALDWAEENGWGDCGTPVGKRRANQLAKREGISRDTIARMASFARHLQYDDKELGDGCAKLMIYAWGGREGIEWAQRKLKEIDKETFTIEPKTNETREEFMSRCIATEVSAGYPMKQALAICYSKLEQFDFMDKKDNKNEMKKEEFKKFSSGKKKFIGNQKFDEAVKTEQGELIIIAEELAVGQKAVVVMDDLAVVDTFDGEVFVDDETITLVGGEITEITKTETEEEVEIEASTEEEEVIDEEIEAQEEVTETPSATRDELISIINEVIEPKLLEIYDMISNIKTEMSEKEEEVVEETMEFSSHDRLKRVISFFNQ